ncbi:MAG: ATP synthase F1 subunit gamma [Candidatus Omnitrophica bacterium]|nr:ATP synthase F1 subunit gamma [Candidatus Omnitrophota bacterium]
MGRSLKQIKRRIKSVENTEKITRAMEMVSVSKLRGVQNLLAANRGYFQRIDALLSHVLLSCEEFEHPLLKEKKEKGDIALCVVTSDNGLCGVYNGSVIKLVNHFIEKNPDKRFNVIPVGKRGFSYFKRKNFKMPHSVVGIHGRFSAEMSDELAGKLLAIFGDAGISEVYVAYTHFESVARHKPVIEKLLHIDPYARVLDEDGKKKKRMDFSFEPKREMILEKLIPEYLKAKMRLIMVESLIAEHASRMVAMKTATRNAKELKDKLVMLRNKTRQTLITKDVIEIISSYVVLKSE